MPDCIGRERTHLPVVCRHQREAVYLNLGMQPVPKCGGLSDLEAILDHLRRTSLPACPNLQQQKMITPSWMMMVSMLSGFIMMLLISSHQQRQVIDQAHCQGF